MQADILDPASCIDALEGADAVISAVGIGTSRAPTTLYSQGARNLISGMEKHDIERLVAISSEVAADWSHQSLAKLWFALPLLQRIFGATYDDMRRMDIVLWESRVQWTAVRAPRITTAAGKQRYRTHVRRPLRRGWSITAEDMATALLDMTGRADLGRRHIYVAN